MREICEILIVDDDIADLRLMQIAIAEAAIPCHIQTAQNGSKALKMLFECDGEPACPDLVILDLNMPGLNGHEVLKSIKEDQRLYKTPVIVLSSSDDPRDVREAYLRRANCYLTKPTNLDDFIGLVQAIKTFWLRTVSLPGPASADA